MHIAPATVEDAAAIAEVHVRSWQRAYADILAQDFLDRLSVEKRAKGWDEILQKSDSRTLVARDGAGLVAFVSHGAFRGEETAAGRGEDTSADQGEGAASDHGEIWALYAHPDAWGRGAGRALLDASIVELAAAGRHRVSLWVLSRNRRGIDFYTAGGFRIVAGSAKTFELGGRDIEEVRMQRVPGSG